jgi:hypothetical protein
VESIGAVGGFAESLAVSAIVSLSLHALAGSQGKYLANAW